MLYIETFCITKWTPYSRILLQQHSCTDSCVWTLFIAKQNWYCNVRSLVIIVCCKVYAKSKMILFRYNMFALLKVALVHCFTPC